MRLGLQSELLISGQALRARLVIEFCVNITFYDDFLSIIWIGNHKLNMRKSDLRLRRLTCHRWRFVTNNEAGEGIFERDQTILWPTCSLVARSDKRTFSALHLYWGPTDTRSATTASLRRLGKNRHYILDGNAALLHTPAVHVSKLIHRHQTLVAWPSGYCLTHLQFVMLSVHIILLSRLAFYVPRCEFQLSR